MSYRYASDWIKNYNVSNWNTSTTTAGGAKQHIILLVDLAKSGVVEASSEEEIRKNCCNQARDSNTHTNRVTVDFRPVDLTSDVEKTFTLPGCSDSILQNIEVVTKQKCADNDSTAGNDAGVKSFCNNGDADSSNDCEAFINDPNLNTDSDLSNIKALRDKAGGCLCKGHGSSCGASDNDCAVCSAVDGTYECRNQPDGTTNIRGCTGDCKHCESGDCEYTAEGEFCDTCKSCKSGQCIGDTDRNCTGCGGSQGTCDANGDCSVSLDKKTVDDCLAEQALRTDGKKLKPSDDNKCECVVDESKCGEQGIDPGTQGCCNGVPYTKATHVCCNNDKYDKSTYGCCNNQKYNKSTQDCDNNGDIIPTTCSEECKIYDSNSRSCIADTAKEGSSCTPSGGRCGECKSGVCSSIECPSTCVETQTHGCCGTTQYNKATKACCSGVVRDRQCGFCQTPSADGCSCSVNRGANCPAANGVCGKCDMVNGAAGCRPYTAAEKQAIRPAGVSPPGCWGLGVFDDSNPVWNNGQCDWSAICKCSNPAAETYKRGMSNTLQQAVCCPYASPRVSISGNSYACVECTSNVHCDADRDISLTVNSIDQTVETANSRLCYNSGGACSRRSTENQGCCINNLCHYKGENRTGGGSCPGCSNDNDCSGCSVCVAGVCTPPAECPDGQTKNTSTCECECSKTCSRPKSRLDTSDCTCKCPVEKPDKPECFTEETCTCTWLDSTCSWNCSPIICTDADYGPWTCTPSATDICVDEDPKVEQNCTRESNKIGCDDTTKTQPIQGKAKWEDEGNPTGCTLSPLASNICQGRGFTQTNTCNQEQTCGTGDYKKTKTVKSSTTSTKTGTKDTYTNGDISCTWVPPYMSAETICKGRSYSQTGEDCTVQQSCTDKDGTYTRPATVANQTRILIGKLEHPELCSGESNCQNGCCCRGGGTPTCGHKFTIGGIEVQYEILHCRCVLGKETAHCWN